MVLERVEHKQQSQMATRNTSKPPREFKIGDTVFAEDFTPSSQKWIEGTITEVTGPISYKIKLTDGTIVRRHVDSIKQRHDATGTTTAASEAAPDFEGPTIVSETQGVRQSQLISTTPRLPPPPEHSELLIGVRRSTRVKRPPQRYMDVPS